MFDTAQTLALTVIVLALIAAFLYLAHIRWGKWILDRFGLEGLPPATAFSKAFPHPLQFLTDMIRALPGMRRRPGLPPPRRAG